MTTTVGVEHLPNAAAKIGLEHHDVMPTNGGHAWRWCSAGKLEPIGRQPEFANGMAEHPDGGAATAEG